jgi:hypothetical protein
MILFVSLLLYCRRPLAEHLTLKRVVCHRSGDRKLLGLENHECKRFSEEKPPQDLADTAVFSTL